MISEVNASDHAVSSCHSPLPVVSLTLAWFLGGMAEEKITQHVPLSMPRSYSALVGRKNYKKDDTLVAFLASLKLIIMMTIPEITPIFMVVLLV